MIQDIIDTELVQWGASKEEAKVILGGDQPWTRRVIGGPHAPKWEQWNGIAARRTTQPDANNHPRYLMTRKNLVAAGCTGEPPLLVIARNRVFLCILHRCMAFGRLFVAFLEAEVGNHPPKVAGEVQKILYRNRCGVCLAAHNAPDGEEAHNLFWAWERLWGCEHCCALCTRRFRLCRALRANLLLLRFGDVAAGSRGRPICCSSKRAVIPCSRVRMHVGWDRLSCRGTLWRA